MGDWEFSGFAREIAKAAENVSVLGEKRMRRKVLASITKKLKDPELLSKSTGVALEELKKLIKQIPTGIKKRKR